MDKIINDLLSELDIFKEEKRQLNIVLMSIDNIKKYDLSTFMKCHQTKVFERIYEKEKYVNEKLKILYEDIEKFQENICKHDFRWDQYSKTYNCIYCNKSEDQKL